ncbi:MAG: ATP-binding cassette domain-containing protein [Alphaproteobacteria bacterium]|nr:ATP-binding cassette domain-containing protein [Alphaproteobacteria bacterium]MBV9378723.1 ATP-binding cassette domain-containing protein [Alphaproteobacteria bacterium]
MRIDLAILGKGSRSAALVWRLAGDFMRPHLPRVVLAFLLMGLAAASTAGRAWLMQPVLDRIFVAREGSLLLLIAGGAFALALIKGLADYGEAVLMTRVGQRVIADVQIALFARLMRADLAFFHAHPSGTLVSRFTSDAALLRNATANVLAGIGKDAVTVIFLVGVMFYQDWLLALVSFFVFPLAIRPIVAIGRRIRRVTANAQAEIGEFTTLLSQTFQGARHVKAYGMEQYEERRAAGLIERLFALIDRGTRTRSRASPLMEALGGTAIAIVILYGGHQVISGARTPGALFSFITALLLAYQPLKSLANLNASLQEGLAAAQRIFEVLDVEPTIRDMPGAKRLCIGGGEIRFHKVSFGYVPGTMAIEDLSLTIPAGHTVALVGPSGAGKSTILNLIPRFFDVGTGSITIDAQDVRRVTIASLRGAIALVAQEISLFDDTVRANIAYGRFGASAAEIEAAAQAADADAFIRQLPQGYDTMVGEHGVRLSGGQRQRIAIARAMLKDAPILLLDEATSALDSESERHVQRALNALIRGRTTLVIAHRLSTVQGADLICVVDRGRIVETGRHAELLARAGLYARLYAMQFAEQRDAATV